MSGIEDIILDRDMRGIAALRGYLPADFCREAASLILDHPGPALVCSGFHILKVGAPETDGPPGAYLLGQTLHALGYEVTHVTDRYSGFLYEGLPDTGELVEFPITDTDSSKRYAEELLARLQPTVVIATERCGLTATGHYLNMYGIDISDYNAKLDYLVMDHPATVGIGDGGNEIGMGNLVEHIPSVPTLVSDPTTMRVSKLIIASVSNWGVYGLIAGLSEITNRNLLPTVEEEEEVIRHMVDKGAVDGPTGKQVYAVDAFPLEENRQTLERLHALLAEQGITRQQ